MLPQNIEVNLFLEQDKDEEKIRKADGKAAKKEEERLAKEKRKSLKSEEKAAEPVPVTKIETAETENTIAQPPSVTTVISASRPESTIAERREVVATPLPIRTSMEDQASLRMRENADAANGSEITPLSPEKSPKGGHVKSWLKSKFSKRNSKIEKSSSKPSPKGSPKAESFVGGAALAGVANDSTASLGGKSSSIKDVALAGKEKEIPITPPEEGERVGRSTSRASTVSSLSEEAEFQEAKDHFDPGLTPPQPKFAADKAHSPARDSKFKEII